MQQNPSIKVTISVYPSMNYDDRMLMMMAGGFAPDVFFLYGWSIPGFEKALLPLGSASSGAIKDLNDFYPAVLECGMIRGVLYGIPCDWTTDVLYYNMDMFDRAGLPYPAGNWKWADFLTNAMKLTKDTAGNGSTNQYGLFCDTWAMWYMNWIYQNGGKVFDEQGKFILTGLQYYRTNAQAVQFVADMMNEYRIAPPVDVSWKSGGSWKVFIEGKTAMCIAGRWIVPLFQSITNFRWNYTVLPYQTQHASMLSVTMLCAGKYSLHPEQSKIKIMLIEFLTSPQSQTEFAKTGMAIPSRMSVAQTGKYLDLPALLKNQPQMKTMTPKNDPFILQLDDAYSPYSEYWLALRVIMDEEFDGVFHGYLEPIEALRKIEKRMDELDPKKKWEEIKIEE
jgi:multiple sugar transport system substrate-binding protein